MLFFRGGGQFVRAEVAEFGCIVVQGGHGVAQHSGVTLRPKALLMVRFDR